jgi:chromate transport protein ChrA
MYNALWYFPLLMFLAGCTSVTYDSRILHPAVRWIARSWRKPSSTEDLELPTVTGDENVSPNLDSRNSEERMATEVQAAVSNSNQTAKSTVTNRTGKSTNATIPPATEQEAQETRIIPAARALNISWQAGTAIITTFFLIFITIMVLRGTLPHRPLLFSLFSNMFLAGTIIFGGGPVVIPLLRVYVVSEGWVSPRDFLLGLAIIQAFPGPNFNFAVYLGGLTAVFGGHNAAAGAVLGYLGIFLPGILTVHGTMGIWSAIRGKGWVKSALRGINAAAVGLIYTAVYRLWQIGYVDEGFQAGSSLGDDPWWVVVGATSFVGGMWFGVAPPVAILLGTVMGLVRYGVVRS